MYHGMVRAVCCGALLGTVWSVGEKLFERFDLDIIWSPARLNVRSYSGISESSCDEVLGEEGFIIECGDLLLLISGYATTTWRLSLAPNVPFWLKGTGLDAIKPPHSISKFKSPGRFHRILVGTFAECRVVPHTDCFTKPSASSSSTVKVSLRLKAVFGEILESQEAPHDIGIL